MDRSLSRGDEKRDNNGQQGKLDVGRGRWGRGGGEKVQQSTMTVQTIHPQVAVWVLAKKCCQINIKLFQYIN